MILLQIPPANAYPQWLITIVMGVIVLTFITSVGKWLLDLLSAKKALKKKIEDERWQKMEAALLEVKTSLRANTHIINIVDIKADSIIGGFSAVNHDFNTQFCPKQQEVYKELMQDYRDRRPELFEKVAL